MPTNVQVSFRFSVRINPSDGSPAYFNMTPDQKVAAKLQLVAAVEQEAVADVVASWGSVAISTSNCCEIADTTLREAVQAKLDAAESALSSALGFMPTLVAGAPAVSCVCLPDGKHVCRREFSLLKGESGPEWTETSATYELSAPIILTAQWMTPTA